MNSSLPVILNPNSLRLNVTITPLPLSTIEVIASSSTMSPFINTWKVSLSGGLGNPAGGVAKLKLVQVIVPAPPSTVTDVLVLL